MSFSWTNYTLAELRAHATHAFRKGGGSRPDVLLIEIAGQRAVLKDQNGADKWFALLLGPLLNWRECKALAKLAAVDCIPELYHQPDARSFLMSYHRSEQITRLQEAEVDWPDFFDKLTLAIEQVHRAGVAHNDLRNPTNTLLTPEGDPVLVDLVACFCKGQAWNFPNLWLFNKFCQVDKSAMTKMKSRLAPDLLAEHDIIAEQIAGRPGMAVRALGQWIRRVSRLLFTK